VGRPRRRSGEWCCSAGQRLTGHLAPEHGPLGPARSAAPTARSRREMGSGSPWLPGERYVAMRMVDLLLALQPYDRHDHMDGWGGGWMWLTGPVWLLLRAALVRLRGCVH